MLGPFFEIYIFFSFLVTFFVVVAERMVKIGLQLKALLENVTGIEAEGEDFRRQLHSFGIDTNFQGGIFKFSDAPKNAHENRTFSESKFSGTRTYRTQHPELMEYFVHLFGLQKA